VTAAHPDLLQRKRTHFLLWRPHHTAPPPAIFIGRLAAGPGAPWRDFREIALAPSAEFPELWEVAADGCGLEAGCVYHYWFKLRDSQPGASGRIVYCTDPVAFTVDRRLAAPAAAEEDGEAGGQPAAVVLFAHGRLSPCDPGGETVTFADDPGIESLPPNSRLVIYELPTRWASLGEQGGVSVGRGTFRDVLSLVAPEAAPPGFEGVAALAAGRAHLLELGVNALELLPPADSDQDLGWGYGTAHFFAPDFDLGGGSADRAPTASRDLAALIQTCHRKGIRFFADMVTAFARNNPYRRANFPDFFVEWRSPGDPQRDPEQGSRDGFGGDLFKYNQWVEGYHPLQGGSGRFVPARELMKAQAAHWVSHFRVDGIRLDSVDNTGSWDFLQELKDAARAAWREQDRAQGCDPEALEERFLVVGEELHVPLGLLDQGRLDGLWNERFKHLARQVVLGRTASEDLSFEWSVRRLIDCRLMGFKDGAQAVNYLTSHDVGGPLHLRLHEFLARQGVLDLERRIKLAFVCLLTAVGIPMILAGEEFADQHDLDALDEHSGAKQVDPVNYSRLAEPWRQRVFEHVARLVRLRTRSAALAVNDTLFLHCDFEDGKRVVVWRRGRGDDVVVVVANFSDWGTPDPLAPGAEYLVPGFPAAPAGRSWREVTLDREVPPGWAGREPLYPWEAKVYALL
jgi:1,4-alpha-glucan branching enzyme